MHVLHHQGLRGCCTRPKLSLQKQHLQTGLKYVSDHMDQDKTFWRKVCGHMKQKLRIFV